MDLSGEEGESRAQLEHGSVRAEGRLIGGGFQDRFSECAAGYAAHRPTYPRALANYLASICPRTELAWDAGCGSGQLTRTLAKCFDRVIATDPSEDQLRNAEPIENVEFRISAAEVSDIPTATADLAVAAQAAHWFDIDRYYAEVRRVVRPGGAIALIGYARMIVSPAIDAVVNDYYVNTLAAHWTAARAHVEAGYRTLPFPFEELPAPDLSINMNWTLDLAIGYLETWSAARSLEKAGGRRDIDQFYRRLTSVWGASTLAREVRFPLGVRAGRVY